MTIVKVTAGACGFATRVKAIRQDNRSVRIRLESDCESVTDLDFVLDETGPFSIKDIMSAKISANRIFQAAWETLPHSACPLVAAIIKAAEVELGLNIPSAVTIEFESEQDL